MAPPVGQEDGWKRGGSQAWGVVIYEDLFDYDA